MDSNKLQVFIVQSFTIYLSIHLHYWIFLLHTVLVQDHTTVIALQIDLFQDVLEKDKNSVPYFHPN